MGAGGGVHVGLDLGQALDVGVDVGQVLALLVLALQGYMVGVFIFVLKSCSEPASCLQLGCEPHLVPKMWSLVGQVSAFLVLVDCCVTIGCL